MVVLKSPRSLVPCLSYFIFARFLFCNAILVRSFWHRFLGIPIYLILPSLKNLIVKSFWQGFLEEPNLFDTLGIIKKKMVKDKIILITFV